MNPNDNKYCGLPWRAGGRSRAGLDCAGLAQLWLTEQMGLRFTAPASGPDPDCEAALGTIPFKAGTLSRGDVVFFRRGSAGKVCHVTVYLGEDRYLGIANGLASRIESSQLLKRIGMVAAGSISPQDAERICLALGGRPDSAGAGASAPAPVAALDTNTESYFEEILGLVCEWVAETERRILELGTPLAPQQMADASQIGVKHPEKVRVLSVSSFEWPQNEKLSQVFLRVGFYPVNMAATHHHYGILIRHDLRENREILAHELTHVKQHETLGGLQPYYREYIRQFRTYGYELMPLEVEARATAMWLTQ